MGKRRQDQYGKKARQDGFPARSVYKLEEIDRRTQLLKRGARVLDLGASPGSWTLYAAKKIGAEGRVLGFDLKPHKSKLPHNADIQVGDVNDIEVATLGEFDVVLSDMAPATSGKRDLDQYRSFDLYHTALRVADRVLKLEGSFVGKIFQGPEFEEARELTRVLFKKVRVIRPKATRKESYEVFLVGLERKDAHLLPVPENQEQIPGSPDLDLLPDSALKD